MNDGVDRGFGLYIHWPFCEAKCPYCDFNSHVASRVDQGAWREAYLSEIERTAAETPDRIVSSVYFGGGTPSLMDPLTVGDILETVQRSWRQSNEVEITLEANPSSVEIGRFQGYRDAGVNRVSVGVQALNDMDLKRLGRLHTAAEARSAVEVANTCFERVSFDLIYARQDQTLADWRTELTEALDMGTDHLSLYQLTLEDGTAFADRHRRGGLRGLPDEDLAADLYELTQHLCCEAGLPAYEISNHAGRSGPSRHNLIYWRGGDYVGIGPGAHGRLTLDGFRWATETYLAPALWLDTVARNGHGEQSRTMISPREQAEEYLMMSLRLDEGSDIGLYEELVGDALPSKAVQKLREAGLLTFRSGRLIATSAGRPLLNSILRELLV